MKKKVNSLTFLIAVMVLALFTVYATDCLALSPPLISWTIKTDMPTARGQAATILGDNGLIYVMGGYDGTDELNVVEAYNPLFDTWTSFSSMPFATRGAAVAKDNDGIIYVISGWSGFGLLDVVQAYNTTSNTWETKTPIPSPVWMAGAATGNDGKIYVIGGELSGGIETNQTLIYDPSTDSWSTGPSMPTARSELGVVKGPDGLIYAIGGWNGTSAIATVEAFNPATGKWVKKAPMPEPRLEFGVTVGPDGKIYVIGGGTSYYNNYGPFFNTVLVYDPETDSWSIPTWSESKLAFGRKEFSAVTAKNGRIYAIGGANGWAYITINEEGIVTPPENKPPTAYIDSITPNPAVKGEEVTLTGHGVDEDGSIVAYKWRSSIDGIIGDSDSISVSNLSVGTHTIYFSVQDDDGEWSTEAVATLVIEKPLTEDPLYQQMEELTQQVNNLTSQVETLNQTVDNLTQQVNNLTSQLDSLSDQTSQLSSDVNSLQEEVDGLTSKLNSLYLQFVILAIITIILIIVAIAIVYITRRKTAPASTSTPTTPPPS